MLDILVRNLATPIVALIATLTLALAFLGQATDAALLASTILLNCTVAIIQEWRARTALQRLSLLRAPFARRITLHGLRRISLDKIQDGDHLRLEAGDLVPADGDILTALNCLANESLLTGESEEVAKSAGSRMVAGSIVVAGWAEIRVTATGTHTQAGEIAGRLQTYTQRPTPLQKTLGDMVRYLTYASLGISVLIFLDSSHAGRPLAATLNTVVAGAVAIVPEGLILASTLLLSLGALQMAKKGVLVQRLAAVEGISRLRTLCLDKTGTLTTNRLVLEETSPEYTPGILGLSECLAAFAACPQPLSPTLQALDKGLPASKATFIKEIPFTSSRKWSAVAVRMGTHEECLVLGAPDILAKHLPVPQDLTHWMKLRSHDGRRVLLVVRVRGKWNQRFAAETLLQEPLEVVGAASLLQELRPAIQDTLFYLQAQGVAIKIISGDAPETVRSIAHSAGVLHSERVLTGDQLALLAGREWEKAVRETTVFARVLPEQKERLVATLSHHGFTGMVGDGVNDALALKRADLSVAMADGAQAARQVADIVLLANDFSIFPEGMRLGSQLIMGLQLITGLYANRIIAGLAVLGVSLALRLPYPLLPGHVVAINMVTVAAPALLWSLFPPKAVERKPAKAFLSEALRFGLPNGIISGTAATVLFAVSLSSGASLMLARTIAVAVLIVTGSFSFVILPRSLRAIDTLVLRQWQAGYLIVLPFLLIGLDHFAGIRSFFHLTQVPAKDWPGLVLVVVCSILLQLVALPRHRAVRLKE
jgi:cation-transporting ATPase E